MTEQNRQYVLDYVESEQGAGYEDVETIIDRVEKLCNMRERQINELEELVSKYNKDELTDLEFQRQITVTHLDHADEEEEFGESLNNDDEGE